MIKDLPYPYTSKAQYERSLQTPIGTEWNTRLGFQRGTLPRVVKKVRPSSVSHFCEFTPPMLDNSPALSSNLWSKYHRTFVFGDLGFPVYVITCWYAYLYTYCLERRNLPSPNTGNRITTTKVICVETRVG